MTDLQLYQYQAMILNVVDGDTVDVTIDLGFNVLCRQRLRLLGVDTPERGEKGYYEAKDWVNQNYLGHMVYMRSEKKDSFGRWLAVLYDFKTKTCINDELINKGLAKVYGA